MKQKIGRKLLSFLLALAMVVGLMQGMSLTAYAADDAKYREYAWSETSKTLSYEDKDIPVGVTELATDTVSWTDGGWYIVPEEGVTIGNRITVTGTANLILRDGATLTASKGITVNSGNTINIYAQSEGTGVLSAGNTANAAGIGGGARYQSGGTVNIHGGIISATGGSMSAGIGGALDGGNGEVNIYSGEVTAQGQNFAAGIGGYSGKSGGTVNIYGGTVNASGKSYGTPGIGIGGTEPGSCVVHIYGGEVTATSEKAAAGIQGTVTIDGGTVTANGGVSDSISSNSGETYSSNGINGTITINGGTVTATGGNVTATGFMSAIESRGGTIYACSGISGTVTISGGTVRATGGNVTGEISSRGGNIYACNGINGTVTISGGTVTATGGSHTGQNSSGTTVKEKGFGGSLTIGDSMKVLGGDSADPTTEIEKSNDDYTRFKYMLVKSGHAHSFNYEASDATITATCSADGCTLPPSSQGGTDHVATLTIAAPTLETYGQTGDGISAEATITDANSIRGGATVVYKKGDETLGSAPTNAGTYTASITLGEGSNSATASLEYTIAQKEVTVSGITASDKVYDGNTDATLVTTAAAVAGKLDGDTLTVTGGTGTFDNANVGENKTVTISNLALDGASKDNYKLAATGQQTTASAKITAKEVGLTWSNTELAYTGEAQKPTATATGVVEGDTCTVTVTGEQMNVGDDYTATAASLSNSNYKLPENVTTTFKIVKGNAVPATVTANNRTYDGTEKPLVTAGTATGGEMQYALGTKDAATEPYTTSIPTKTDAGTYYVWYKVVGDVGHSDTTPACVTVTISGAVDDPGHSVSGKVYWDSTEKGAISGAAVELKQGGTTVKQTTTDDSGNYSFQNILNGSYNIVVTVPASETTKEKTVTLLAVLDSADLEMPAVAVPVENVSSEVKIEAAVTTGKKESEAEAPSAVVAGGMDEFAKSFASESAESGSEITVTLEVQPQTEAALEQTESGATQLNAIKELAGLDEPAAVPAAQKLMLLDLSVFKTTTSADGSSDQEKVYTTSGDTNPLVLEIVFSYETKGRGGFNMFRYHSDDGSAEKGAAFKLDKLGTRPARGNLKDGTFFVGNGFVAVYTDKFSTYAMTFTEGYTVTFHSNGGSAVTSQTVADGGKAVKPANPTRNGYAFNEWRLNGSAYDFDSPVTSDITLTAAWTKNSSGGTSKPGSSGGSSGGGSSAPATPTVTVPVSGESSRISVSATVSGTTANVTKGSSLDAVIGASVKTGNVVIDLSGLNKDINSATIPTDTIKAIEAAVSDPKNDASSLTVKLSDGSVTFDAKALAAIVGQAKGSDIWINLDKIETNRIRQAQQDALKGKDVQQSYDIYVTSDGKEIHDFKGGKAVLTVSYSLKSGQAADGLAVWYVSDDGKTLTELPASYEKSAVTFTAEHFSNYVIAYDATHKANAACKQDSTCPISKFTDGDPKAWYHDGVHYVLENGIMGGMGNGLFGPNETTTRAQVAQILWNMEGSPAYVGRIEFADVDAEAWYAPAVRWSSSEGIINGYDNPNGSGKLFGPDAPITREQLATMLYRYAQSKGQGFTGAWMFRLDYPDAASVSEWADEAMHWMVMNEIINGIDGKLAPQGSATRAQIATMIMRYCTEIEK